MPIVLAVQLGWVLFGIGLFALLPARRAVIIGIIIGWLFLPVGGVKLPGFPDWGKQAFVVLPPLLGVLIFDRNRLFAFRPSWIDLPLALFCLVCVASAVANGTGVYDGLAWSLQRIIGFGIPYLLGRLYCGTKEGMRDLALGFLIGGLIYVPFCIWENRMSPQLHYGIYGYRTYGFTGVRRLGGYRPTVFLTNGLELGLWMTAATLTGVWLWLAGGLRRLWGIPTSVLVPVLTITTLLCRSLNALFLLVMALSALFISRATRTRILLLALACWPLGYIGIRMMGDLSTEPIVSLVASIDKNRANSLDTRFRNEEILIDRAMERPILGWARWGRHRVKDSMGRDIVLTDGYWVILLGQNGLFGVLTFYLAITLPVIILIGRVGVSGLRSHSMAPIVALAFIVNLYGADCLMNAFPVPAYHLALGGIAGIVAGPRRRTGRPSSQVTGSLVLHQRNANDVPSQPGADV